ncbi:NUDIX hydrolase [Actinomadura nitritigenes]|uniref:NUDIX hydrolase n=1 Tax=Actinomadura nitritigenes TaxID=134602 RepID=UPI003D8D527E
MSSMTSPASKACDGHSVGVIIVNAAGQVLIGDRTDGAGAAPIAGHVYDAHPSPRAAARAEVFEEVGLTVTTLTEITSGYRANRCKRGDGPTGPGHTWYIYRARAAGQLDVDPGSYSNVRWADADELRALTERTIAYARGRVEAAEWADRPGIELVWVLWLQMAAIVDVPRHALEQIERCIEQDLAPKASR